MDHHFIMFAIATNNLLRSQPMIIKSCAINSQTTQSFLELERKWRHTKLEVYRRALKVPRSSESTAQYRRALTTARSSYFSNLIEENKNNPK